MRYGFPLTILGEMNAIIIHGWHTVEPMMGSKDVAQLTAGAARTEWMIWMIVAAESTILVPKDETSKECQPYYVQWYHSISAIGSRLSSATARSKIIGSGAALSPLRKVDKETTNNDMPTTCP